MNDISKRCVGYGAGAAVLSVLVWAGFIRVVPPDVGTLLSAIDTQLRLAHGMPAVDQQGVRLSARDEMLAEAGRRIDQARAQAPDLAAIEEYRGFLHMLRDEPRQAAACYQKARGMQGCDADMRDTLTFNEARMLQKAGDSAAALAVFTASGDSIQAKWRSHRELECAGLLAELGRTDEAEARLLPLIAAAADDPMAAVRAGELLLRMGRTTQAERAFAAAGTVSALGTYRLAVLKLSQGQTDRSLELLARAEAASPGQVRKLVQQDQKTWQALAADARVKQLLEPGELTGSSR